MTPHRAVSICNYSAFTGEEEYILPPGTQFKVIDVAAGHGGLATIKLEEEADARLVS